MSCLGAEDDSSPFPLAASAQGFFCVGYAGMRIAAAERGLTADRSEAGGRGAFLRLLEVEKSESRAVGSMAAAAASSLPMLGPERRV